MFQEAFTKLNIEEIASILDHINKKVEGSLFDPLDTTILAISLPFYPGYRFLDISDHATNPPLRRYAFQKDNDFTILDWSYKPIYELNKKAPIILDSKSVIEYIRFFFSFVKGRHGRFILCESLENINWKEEPPIASRKSLGKMMEPLKIIEKLKNGTFKLEARMMLKDALFKAEIYVDSTGKVTLENHEILIEGMPVLDQVMGH